MTSWRPFPPGAQALMPPGYIVSHCATCKMGTVDFGGLNPNPMRVREDNLTLHGWLHREGLTEPTLIDPTWRDLMRNIALALDEAAREQAHSVPRKRGIRQARSLRHPWLAWLWELLP